jgi:hypothetical protein
MLSHYIKSLGFVLPSDHQIFNLYYVDDIFIFLHDDQLMLEKLK